MHRRFFLAATALGPLLRARLAQRVLKDLDLYIAATQLGITMASLGIGFLAEPADVTTTLDTGVVPVSAPDCPDDLLDKIQAGDVAIDVGVEVTIAVTIDQPVSGSSSSGGGEVQCSDAVATCNCSVRACASSDGSCWYESSSGRYDCSSCGSGCQGAASALIAACCPSP